MNEDSRVSRLAIAARRVLAFVLVLMLLTGTALAASKKATVYSSSMKVYKKASTSSSKLGSLSKGTSFTITAYNSTWAKISYKGYTGYALLKDVKLASSERAKAYTTKKTAVYKSGSSSSGKLGYIDAGTCIYIAGRNGNYMMCQNKSGSVTGYIHKDNLSWNKPSTSVSTGSSSSSSGSSTGSSSSSANTGSNTVTDSRAQMPSSLKSTTTSCSSSSSDSTKIEYIVYVAQNQLGKRYDTDPSAPSTFDCAGLVYYCYKKAGIKVSSSAKSQGYDDKFTKIENISDLKRGDMVCFNTNATDGDLSDHTGIYLGSGKFIHASSGAGLVIVSDLTSGYYYRNFSWGRRILE